MSISLISVIIPHYNHAKELQETLKSIFGQTIQDQLEVIVVDDGSEKSQISNLKSQILPKYPQAKFILIEHQGAPAARNRGFKESQGEYVIFWDADIAAKPETLEKMLKVLGEHPEVSFVYSSFKFGWKTFKCGPFDAERLKKVNYITSTSLIRREHFPGFSANGAAPAITSEAVGRGPASGWDESLQKFQDWDLWLTMSEQGHQGYWLDEVLFVVQPRRGGMSAWLPSFVYRFPWLPISALKRYKYWEKIILKKHGLIKD